MKSLVFGKLEVCYLGFGLLIMMDWLFADGFVENLASVICLWIKIILLLQYFAHVKDQLLFDRIRIFSHFEVRWHQLILRQLHS